MTPEEQAAADAATAAAEASKATEAQAAADAAKAEATRSAPGIKQGMSEDEIVALEKQTGFKREQLNTVAVLVQQASSAGPMSRVVEKETFNAAKSAILSQGVKEITPELEKKVEEHLSKLTPAERQNPKLVENVIWIERGRLASAAPAAARTSTTRVMTGADDGAAASPEGNDAEFAKLSEEEKQYFALGKFKDMKEYKTYQKREIDTGYEKNWKPTFNR